MSERALRSALRLRTEAVAAARRDLADATALQQQAAAELAARAAAIQREIAMASRAEADDAAVEALGTWLREARAGTARAEAALTAAEAATAQVRAALAAARSAEAAVATLIAARTAAQVAAAERDAQLALTEAALRPFTARNQRRGN